MNAWLHDVASQRRLELSTRSDGRLLAKADSGSGTHRIAVISVPKAGTYMLARFLSHVGYVDSELHVAEFLLTDYRGLSTEQKRGAAFRERVFQVPIGVSAGLVAEGQFAVGHLPCTPYVRSSLQGFRKIFMYRNLIDAIFSRLRFRIDSGREPRSTPWVTMPPGPEQALAYLADVGRQRLHAGLTPLLDWLDEPGVIPIAYEHLVGDQGQHESDTCIARLAEAVGIPLEFAASVFTTRVLGHPTPTLSGRRTEAAVYLDKRVEAILGEWGIADLNARLGYAS